MKEEMYFQRFFDICFLINSITILDHIWKQNYYPVFDCTKLSSE